MFFNKFTMIHLLYYLNLIKQAKFHHLINSIYKIITL